MHKNLKSNVDPHTRTTKSLPIRDLIYQLLMRYYNTIGMENLKETLEAYRQKAHQAVSTFFLYGYIPTLVAVGTPP